MAADANPVSSGIVTFWSWTSRRVLSTDARSDVFTAPLYAIDNDFYNSWYSEKFHRYFENDLRGIERKAKPQWSGNLYFFEYDKLVKVTRELPNS